MSHYYQDIELPVFSMKSKKLFPSSFSSYTKNMPGCMQFIGSVSEVPFSSFQRRFEEGHKYSKVRGIR